MKKTIYILATVLALVLSACTPDPVSENAVFLTEEAVAQMIADDGDTSPQPAEPQEEKPAEAKPKNDGPVQMSLF